MASQTGVVCIIKTVVSVCFSAKNYNYNSITATVVQDLQTVYVQLTY